MIFINIFLTKIQESNIIPILINGLNLFNLIIKTFAYNYQIIMTNGV